MWLELSDREAVACARVLQGESISTEDVMLSQEIGLRIGKIFHDRDQRERSTDLVNHPDHYGGDTPYEVIKVLVEWGLDKDALLFNVVKYVARAGKKTEDLLEDLLKSAFYLNYRIELLQGKRVR